MQLQSSDENFLNEFVKCIKFVTQTPTGFFFGVNNLYGVNYYSSWKETVGVSLDELRTKILTDSLVQAVRKRTIEFRENTKLLVITSFGDLKPIMFTLSHSPIINTETSNVVGIMIISSTIDIPNLASIFAKYYDDKNSAVDYELDKRIQLTEREKQVVFFFLLNLESQTISEILTKIENKRISKNAIDQVFYKQLFPKFEVYNRKALYQKLLELHYNRIIPHNVLQKEFIMDITDYVIFN